MFQNKWKIEAKEIIWIFKGREWRIEDFGSTLLDLTWYFTKDEILESEQLIILKTDEIDWTYLTFRLESCVENKIIPKVDELKKQTKFNNDFYIITNIDTLKLSLNDNELSDYMSILKHCNQTQISIMHSSNSKIRQILSKIKSIPRKCKLRLNIEYPNEFVFSGGLDLTKNNLDNIELYLSPFNILVKKVLNSTEKTNLKRMFIVHNKNKGNESIVSIKKLKEMISKNSFD